jgi:hypothetical protein
VHRCVCVCMCVRARPLTDASGGLVLEALGRAQHVLLETYQDLLLPVVVVCTQCKHTNK